MMRAFLALLFCGLVYQSAVFGQEKLEVQDWKIQSNGLITEAYTAPVPDSTFGLFCSAENCIFYLHQALACQPNTKYSVLMNSLTISTAITMKCTAVGADLFWILSPFETVLRATQVGDQIGFAVALQSGAFAVSRFSLAGGKQSINQALVVAAKKKQPLPNVAPPSNIPNKPPTEIPRKKDILI
jgi:hypothetical protein